MFEEIVATEDKEQSKNHIIKEFIHLLTNEEVAQRLVDILYMLKDESIKPIISKNIAYMSSNTENYFDPQVDLQINESLIPKVVLDFGSQVNILTKDTWEKHGWPQLVKSEYYLKLSDQGLIEPLGLCRNIETTLIGISVRIKFKVIEPREGSKSYLALVGWPWDRKMKANIFLGKHRIKLKGQAKKFIIPLDPKEGELWDELDDSEEKVRQLYKVIQSNLDMIEPNDQGELDIGSLTLSDVILTLTYMIGN